MLSQSLWIAWLLLTIETYSSPVYWILKYRESVWIKLLSTALVKCLLWASYCEQAGDKLPVVVLSSLPELLFHCSQHSRSLQADHDVLQGLFQRIGEFHNHRHFSTSYQFTFGLQDKERTMHQKLIITDTQYWQGRRTEHTAEQHKAKEV